MFKMGVRKILGYDIYFDIGLTVLMMVSLSGTFSGMIIALLIGLIISVTLLLLRKCIGMERYEKFRTPSNKIDYQWVRYPGWFV